MLPAPLDRAIDLQRLRQRTSEKWARYPEEVLPVFVAESDFPLAEPIAQRLSGLIARGDTGYALPRGLGEAYAAFAERRYGAAVDPADVCAIPEVMVGVAEILRVAAGTGDAVVINSPVYPPFFSTIEEVGLAVADAPLRRDGTRYSLDTGAIERRFKDGARVFLLCNPHNPVGRIFARDELLAIAALAERYGVLVLADEIHGPLALPGTAFVPFSTIAAQTGCDAIALTSASKGWNVAGLKCALAVAHGARARTVLDRLPVAMTERTGHFGVHATIAAFRDGLEYLDTVVAHLDAMRARLRAILDDAGLGGIAFGPPEAGYLAWLDCSALGLAHPATAFYKRGKVAVNPGERFGAAYGQWVRFNFATSTSIVTEAVRRMASACEGSERG